jgi:hypothetical protein
MDIDLFVIQSEEAFNLKFDDATLTNIKTIGEFIDYVHMKLPRNDSSNEVDKLSERMLNYLSIQISSVIKCSLSSITPSTPLADLFPNTGHDDKWKHVRTLIGAKYWPEIKRLTRWYWFKPKAGTFDRPLCTTVMDVVTFLVARSPSLVKSDTEGWKRTEVVEVVKALAQWTFGLPDHVLSENLRFVEDLLLE